MFFEPGEGSGEAASPLDPEAQLLLEAPVAFLKPEHGPTIKQMLWNLNAQGQGQLDWRAVSTELGGAWNTAGPKVVLTAPATPAWLAIHPSHGSFSSRGRRSLWPWCLPVRTSAGKREASEGNTLGRTH
ncbi:hypothetical protein WJX72_010047 [[Myrmecia] bisecta]|uniref:Uncharacterized protein n=1 Tax=[Myrmecia] bisecta TaxID=41462 RepID=A0AAW1QSC8_9CHLO